MRSRPMALALALAALAASGCGQERPAGGASDAASDEVVLTPEAAAQARNGAREERRADGSRPQVVQLEGAGSSPRARVHGDDAPSPGAASDAEVRAELHAARRDLRRFKSYLSSAADLREGRGAKVLSDGTAQAPEDAPAVVKRVILAANQIAKFPYKWGGGHGAWKDSGYDCSGSVSFALAGAGLLDSPMTSGGFAGWGDEGPGDWITIYANDGHMFMLVAGLRFDTSGRGRAGTRWQPATRPAGGYAVRHPPGY